MGDPNGTFFWKDNYHLFYQYNPDGSYDDAKRMHWGHAISKDLVNWTDLPIALAPEPNSPDRLGCYSGAALNWDGIPTLIYYGQPDGICIATTTDDNLITWEKHKENPIIPHDPKGKWRVFDPCAWKEGDDWYALSGGKIENQGDTAFLFKSSDFIRWEYMGLLYEPGMENDCAVPDFFPINNKHVLLFSSHKKGVQYYIGTYNNQVFTPENHGRMNFGGMGLETGELCAAFTLLDNQNRRILLGWVPEGRKESIQRLSGWAGVMCLPRVLSLSENNEMRIDPLPELKSLRRKHHNYSDLRIKSNSSTTIDGILTECAEIYAEFNLRNSDKFGLKVCCSPNEEEETIISYSNIDSSLSLDVNKSSLSDDMVGRGIQRSYLNLKKEESLKLRVFIDRSIIEVFANSKLCLTKRIYPSMSNSRGVRLFSNNGEIQLNRFEIWEMAPVW